MKNMGFTSLRIAEPKPIDDPAWYEREAGKMAWDAVDLLGQRREFPTIDAALSDATLVAGTTWKPPEGYSALPPRALAGALLDGAGSGRVALLFGQESIGLTLEAMTRCSILGAIPASPEYASLNLAQSVLIFLYEIRMEALGRFPVQPPESDGRAELQPPERAEVEAFYARLEEALGSIGYFEGTSAPHMTREVRKIFNRSITTRRELAILEGIVHRMRLRQPRGRR
jgi:TrmH family RNA methyltransferase